MPLRRVVWIPLASGTLQYGLQRDSPEAIGSLPEILEAHGASASFALKLTQLFMLITWLCSVSRSIRAALR